MLAILNTEIRILVLMSEKSTFFYLVDFYKNFIKRKIMDVSVVAKMNINMFVLLFKNMGQQ